MKKNNRNHSLRLVHVRINCYNCITKILDNPHKISEMLLYAVKAGKMKLVHLKTHHFKPHGVTGYALLGESHISIHTWPEIGFAIVEISTCNPVGISKVISVIKGALSPGEIELKKDEFEKRFSYRRLNK